MKRILSISAALLALSAAATACTSSDDGTKRADKPSQKACSGGTYEWSVARRAELTGLAKPIHLKKDGQPYTAHIKSVDGRFYVAGVTPAGGGKRGDAAKEPKPAQVLASLRKELGTEEPLAKPGEKYMDDKDGLYFENATGDPEGHYFAYSYINLVEGDYRYTCGDGKPVEGHVVTWTGTGSGTLPCAARIEDDAFAGEPDMATVESQAAQASCPPGSAALKDPA
ncbi:hypothetical protein H9Y04_00500 [Streptomyces sp. TRM66268-LWL]|uniref:Lipoprotein n=1 Tax=Streptomyces polyasparticus TaxID=2767826 RepID=A0ABR7S9N6_9ACTN|nr:hypothetical protein [Streptomyces polyasparticus]MBC9711053.1 hypothetical protein [Streptomyces polyasparticus]